MESKKLYESYIKNTYEDLTELSKSKNGATCLAKHKETGKLVIKKQVGLEIGEIYQKLKDIKHPNLVSIYEVHTFEKYCMVIEEYVSGETIGEILEKRGVFTEDAAKYFSIQILQCLQVIHKNGLVHRDLTPSNILISTDQVVKILDFGIARTIKETQARDTVIMGTEGYASPEQFGFRQTDARTDIYAFGVLLNQMLTGKMPQEYLTENRKFRKVIKNVQ